MTILVLDFWFGRTHQRTNIRTIEILSGIADVIATNFGDYYKDITGSNNIRIVDVKCHNKCTTKLHQRFRSIYNIIETWKKVKDLEYDAILVTGYEVISIAVMPFIFGSRVPVYLQYHQHVDEVVKPIKKSFFKIYQNKVHHVFLEESFAEYFLKCTGTETSRVHVVHHFIMDRIRDNKSPASGVILGISSSNDENIVRRLITDEDSNSALKKNKIRMHLRSAENSFDDGFLVVDNQYLAADEYKRLFDEAEAILVIPPKEKFRNRVSGLIYDALASGKKVIGVDIKIMRIMKHYAPSMFHILNDENRLIELIRSVLRTELREEDLLSVRRRHSDARIMEDYRKMFGLVDSTG